MTKDLSTLNEEYKNCTDCDERTGLSVPEITRAVLDHLRYSFAKNTRNAKDRDLYLSASLAIRDRLIHRWMKTMKAYYVNDVKRVYYLSAEYLLGRALGNNLQSLGIYEASKKMLEEYSMELSTILEQEPDPGLGNGGLGRLAASFLDSLATLGYPALGYGIRYEFGIFKQKFENGYQVEERDPWLEILNPWEIRRMDLAQTVHFGGRVEQHKDYSGKTTYTWVDTETVRGVPYDMPVAGFNTNTVNSLRLWSAQASNEFNLKIFNAGDFREAVKEKVSTETISKVLYPADNNLEGKELRLRQQYFFVSCSIQDLVRRYKKTHVDFDSFSDKVAIQLNDTHPAIAIAELMHILVDKEGLGWDHAWEITQSVFGYTNHTLLPEALERWPLPMFEKLLPRHLQIIYEINRIFLRQVHIAFPRDKEIQKRVSIIDESDQRYIRMANLAVVGSHSVNGVAKIHSELVKTDLFPDFYALTPHKFNNKTNGITPRRWLLNCNPQLSELITHHIGEDWKTDAAQLTKLTEFAKDPDFIKKVAAIKRDNKQRLINRYPRVFKRRTNADMLFDSQIKRIHEYKRQLLNILHVIHLYAEIKRNPDIDRIPRVMIFAGKAAPGYAAAKQQIKLINDVASIVNQDPLMRHRLHVAMLPNYSVSMAEIIIPATELSEQISTAGKEASGTGNMKFALNGALTIGTLDGANIEIRENVGADNFFLFGLKENEVKLLREEGYRPSDYIRESPALESTITLLEDGFFSPDDRTRFQNIVDWLREDDPYMICADFDAYVACQLRVDEAYRNPEKWTEMAIQNIANMGYFSSDRTIKEYAEDIWKVSTVKVDLEN